MQRVDEHLKEYKRVILVGAIAPPVLSNGVSSGSLPLGAMALSAFLKQKGIYCKVVSTAFPDAMGDIYNDLNSFDLLGISSMSGPYLNYAISVARSIKRIRPNLPIVWGGPHASLMDEDLIYKDFVDFIIRGIGEKSLFKLIQALEGKSSFSLVPGLTWIENGCIRRNNPDTDFHIDEMPQLDYSLLSNRYSYVLNKEFSYLSSRGCPFNCSYCVASQLYNRCWYDKSEDKVINELKDAYDEYKFKSIFFWDDNLFVNIRRLCNILSKLNNLGIHFQWSGFCRAETFSRLDDEIIGELKGKGLKWLSVGAESGSQKILDKLKKGNKVDDIKRTAAKLRKWHIMCDFSFMGGIPGETLDDFNKTLDLLKWIKDIYPQAAIRVFRFIPYPKMPILDSNKEIKALLPTDIYGWSKLSYQNARFPWVHKKINRALAVLSPASLFSEKPQGISLKNIIITLLYYITQFRFKVRFFYFPIEGLLVEKAYNRISSKKLNSFNKCLNETEKGVLDE